MASDRTVTIVVNTYNQARFLADSLASCLAQTRPAEEIIVVDDGSTEDDPATVIAGFPGVKLIRHANRGLAAARNTGLWAASGEYVQFLDADDRLTPAAVEAGLVCMAEHPDAALVYGAHRQADPQGRAYGPSIHRPLEASARLDLLTHGNQIMMHGTVLYKKAVLQSLGGFDESLRMCEDYDLYLRFAELHRLAWHRSVVAEYRQYPSQMSRDTDQMLRWISDVIDRSLSRSPDDAEAQLAGRSLKRTLAKSYSVTGFRNGGARLARGEARAEDLRRMARSFSRYPIATIGALLERVARPSLAAVLEESDSDPRSRS